MTATDQQQPELWPCPRCQTPIPPTSTFCPNCGFALTQQVQGQQTTGVAAPAAKQGWSTKKKVVVGVIAVFALLVVASALAGPRRAPTPAANQSGNVAPARTRVPAPAAPQTLLTLSGEGIKKSGTFTTTGPWTLSYTYDCSSFGYDGNFIVTVHSPPETLEGVSVNELGPSGSGSTQEYHGGTLYLSMNSTCDWNVKVTQP